MKNKIKRYIFAFILFIHSISFAQDNIFEAPDLYCVRPFATDIALAWNLPTLSACFSAYEIYYSIGNKNGTYNLFTSINNPNQNNIVINNPAAGQTTYFYILQRGICTNLNANIKRYSDTLDNNLSFPSVNIQSVSVVNNAIELKWIPDTYKEVEGYLIFSNKTPANQFNTPIDTVFGNNINTYIDNNVLVDNIQYTYKIRTLMTCDADGAITPDSKDHTSATMNITQTNACNKTASVAWFKYGYEDSDVLNYEIQTRTSGTTFQTIATQANTATAYIIQNVPAQDSVYVRLKINLPNGSFAYSNEKVFYSEVLRPIENDYIRNITILDDNSVVIEYIKDLVASSIRNPINLQTTLNLNTFQNAGNSTVTDEPTRLLYNDKSTQVTEKSYFYRISYRDSCQNTLFSDTVQTLHTTVVEEVGNKAKLTWSGFNIPNIQFINYTIYKVVNDDASDTSVLATINNRNTNTFTDLNFFDTENKKLESVCYYIVANYFHLSDATPREILHSKSNIVCHVPTPKLFIPNAFAPEGHNKTIKPFLLFASEDNYEFIIFNRWNEVMFKTNNINEAWNGTYKGEIAPFDSYVYVISYQDKENKNTYKDKGTFLLLR
jgi:gliding motility-associated-like protein